MAVIRVMAVYEFDYIRPQAGPRRRPVVTVSVAQPSGRAHRLPWAGSPKTRRLS